MKGDDGNRRHEYDIDVSQFKQQVLPDNFPETTVLGYGGLVRDGDGSRYDRQAPGPTFEATRGVPAYVRWHNRMNLNLSHFLPVDGTIHWANPKHQSFPPDAYPIPFNPETRKGIPQIQSPIPMVTHLHGGEDPPPFDGHPEAWFTKNHTQTGQTFITNTYRYLNTQPPTTLWYHDHTLGITRENVYAGLAGFYLIKDPNDRLNRSLPSGEYDVPLVIQDRNFTDDGQLLSMDNTSGNPDVHPYWAPETFGNTVMVNGKVWPNFNVNRRQYRFRFLNGSNARFYRLTLPYNSTDLPFIQIASDGGYLPEPVELTELLLAPGQRVEILIDFSKFSAGTKLILKNDAPAPFSPSKPPLDPSDSATKIMQFAVAKSVSEAPGTLPKKLNRIPKLKPNAPKRILTLNELSAPSGNPIMLLLNGQMWDSPVSERPLVGSTEDWAFVNLTNDTHPMHIHLIQFQIVSRQAFDQERYLADWLALNGNLPLDHPTKTLPVKDYLIGNPMPPASNERGWHDIVAANPGEVTTIRLRFAPINILRKVKPGDNRYSFNPGEFPGYVWHCHILDHEDNEMMRPYTVIVPPDRVSVQEFKEHAENRSP